MADVTMPQLGETVTEGTITQWFKRVGDTVAMDEPLFEVSTDKVDSEVPSPVAGVVSEILASEGDLVAVGQVLCRVGADAVAPAPDPVVASAPDPVVAPAPDPVVAPAPDPVVASAPDPVVAPAPEPAAAAGVLLSPVVRRLIAENQLDPQAITGTGVGGRITRGDVEQYLQQRRQTGAGAPATSDLPSAPEVPQKISNLPPPPPPPPTAVRSASPAIIPPAVPVGPRDEVVELNNIRLRTAEHMVMSKHASPHVLTAMEVDYERVEQARRRHQGTWRHEEGFSLTYLPFIARAVVDALRDFPHLNASFGGDRLIIHNDINLAVAVDLDFNGLLAPVVKGVEGKRLRQIARDIHDLAGRSRSKQLVPDELTGGTFTLTNAGQYGTMMQFPIINQPQVAILSTDGVKRRPVVVTDEFGNESIAIHSVGVLALAWDHRAFDGAYAAAFLNRIQEVIETRDWEAEIL